MLSRLRVLFLFASLFGSAIPALAQDEPVNSLRDGAWALQFGINQHVDFTSFEGSTISARHMVSDHGALRYGLTLGGQFVSQHDEAGASSDLEPEGNHLGLLLSFEYIGYPDLPERVSEALHLYWGIGPNFSFTNARTQIAPGVPIIGRRNLGAGLAGLVGAEWFIAPRVSLTAEYSSALRYERSSRTVDPDDEYGLSTTRSSNVFGLFARGVTFGISAYVSTGG